MLPLTETIVPADEAAMAAVLQHAAEKKTAVYPLGGETNLGYGLLPTRPGIGLSTHNLARVIDHPAGDLTITVEAGLTMAELGKRLASKRQWLPVDRPRADQATVGGAVAANAYGPRRYAYGTIRDYLLGVRAVDGRGKVFAGGGRVVKNAAGYNVPRLLAGSWGTLGVISQVTFMVRPLPQTSAMVLCDVNDFEGIECLLVALGRSRTFPVAIELLAGRWREGCPLPPPPAESVARLIVGFDGAEPEVAWMVRRLAEEWRTAGAVSLTSVTGAGVVSLWDWLSNMASDLQINVLPSALVRLTEEVFQQLPGASIQAHAGNGVIQVQWPRPQKAAAASPACNGAGHDFTQLVCGKLRPAAAALGGNVVMLSAPNGRILSAGDVWGPAPNGAVVMRALRQRFDPEGILNPGRFVLES